MGKGGRPVRNSTSSVPVMFGLGLIQMDLHEKAKILSMSMWTRYVSMELFEGALLQTILVKGVFYIITQIGFSPMLQCRVYTDYKLKILPLTLC